jgi:hypothetical protein
MPELKEPADYPLPDRRARFKLDDFAEVIASVPENCPLIGGQAVAWWAARYGLGEGKGAVITSADIDFWGDRRDLIALARALERRAVFPHEYEMTVWVGAIPLTIHGKKTLVEFLHTVPGLDTNDPVKAAVKQQYRAKSLKRTIPVLSPVSLVMAKLHALRHFKQDAREDEFHLKISLQSSRGFLMELLEQREIRHLLWNCERLIAASQMKPYRGLEKHYHFEIKSAIPIKEIRSEAHGSRHRNEDRKRLENFAGKRWEQLGRGREK